MKGSKGKLFRIYFHLFDRPEPDEKCVFVLEERDPNNFQEIEVSCRFLRTIAPVVQNQQIVGMDVAKSKHHAYWETQTGARF